MNTIQSDSLNQNPSIQLTVSPNSGYSADNIEIRCEISPPTIISSLSSSKFDNVYLSVKTDNVKPSGILLMFHDSADRCQINRENVEIDVCNSSLIIAHVKHTILNETLQKIDYSCSKGSTYAYASYKLTRRNIFRIFLFFIIKFYLFRRSICTLL